MAVVLGKEASGAVVKIPGAGPGGRTSFIIGLSSTCSNAGGSTTDPPPEVSSMAGSELSQALLLGHSGIGLLIKGRRKEVLAPNFDKVQACTSKIKNKTHRRDRFAPEKDHLWSTRSPKTPDHDGVPVSSSTSTIEGGTNSDIGSDSGDAGP